MESPDGQGSGELVELEVGAVEEARPEETSTEEGGNQVENSEQALVEPARDESENKVTADEEAAWTSYKDIMEETGRVKHSDLQRVVEKKFEKVFSNKMRWL